MDDPAKDDPLSLNAEPMFIIGWREWVGLPDLNVRQVKAKIDTGARSSSIHAFDVETYMQDGVERVRFSIHPVQNRDDIFVNADVPILERRHVRSSNGEVSERIVIRTRLEILQRRGHVDLTLANRDAMGFRMLVGREAIRNHFLVDPGASFLAGRHRRKKRRSN
ncbi:MAG: ATP-dependent zinc protease [Rhodopirellula sp. JB053]|uniref:ATP-dependent zinc protease family protein n=1 Tax=Rhodopirellula sp. JB044 TaxID=3342844 RepID=UPI00370B945D